MGGYIVVSNNDAVVLNDEDEFVEGTLLAVLLRARDLVHLGHKLLTHPLKGSVKPNETPYKSIVIGRKGESLDFQSLNMIERSIGLAERMLKECPLPRYSERVLWDFKAVDKDLLLSALHSLKQADTSSE